MMSQCGIKKCSVWSAFYNGCEICIAKLPHVSPTEITPYGLNNQTPYTIVGLGDSYTHRIGNLLKRKKILRFINQQDSIGNTALYYAAMYDNVDYARYLLRRGADPSIEDFEGRSAYDVAGKEVNDLLQKYRDGIIS